MGLTHLWPIRCAAIFERGGRFWCRANRESSVGWVRIFAGWQASTGLDPFNGGGGAKGSGRAKDSRILARVRGGKSCTPKENLPTSACGPGGPRRRLDARGGGASLPRNPATDRPDPGRGGRAAELGGRAGLPWLPAPPAPGQALPPAGIEQLPYLGWAHARSRADAPPGSERPPCHAPVKSPHPAVGGPLVLGHHREPRLRHRRLLVNVPC